ncbi:hypothetical protein B0H14DRAFT_3882173, partial [Mycena olivaceomarginata]
MSTQAVDNTLGALFLGVAVSCCLVSVRCRYITITTTTPTTAYYTRFVCVLDTTHLCLSIASTYHYGVSGFGQHDGLDTIVWPIKFQAAINVVIILVVQSLYAYRVWLREFPLSYPFRDLPSQPAPPVSGYHNGMLGYIVAGVVLGGFGIGAVLSYEISTVNRWSDSGRVAWAIESSYAATTFIDIIISIAMCYYLRKGVTEESPLNSRISRIIQYTLSCGGVHQRGLRRVSLRCASSSASVSVPPSTHAYSPGWMDVHTVLPHAQELVFFALGYLLTRLYVNSFMAMMNSRDRARTNSNSNSVFVLSNRSSSGGFVHSHSRSAERNHSNTYSWVEVPAPAAAASRSSAGTHVSSMSGTRTPLRPKTDVRLRPRLVIPDVYLDFEAPRPSVSHFPSSLF